MLISVCKMIQRVRARRPSGTPAKGRHCMEVRADGLACFSAVLAVQLYKGCTKLSVANVFSSTQTLKCVLLLPLNIILFHVIIFCSIMFLMLYKMFQKIETCLFKSTLKKKFILVIISFIFTGSIITIRICFASLNSQYPACKTCQLSSFDEKALVADICHIYFAKMEMEIFSVNLT